MENQTSQQQNQNPKQQAGNTIKTLGIISTICGLVALSILCVAPVAALLSAAGLACGIIALVKIKNEGVGEKTFPIIGIVASGISFLVSMFFVFGIFAMMNFIQRETDNMLIHTDSIFRQMDSLNNIPLEYIDEPDSTFMIDYIEGND